jgi:hypothetical protein
MDTPKGTVSFGVSNGYFLEAAAFSNSTFWISTSGVSPEAIISCPNQANYFFGGITGICR